MLFKRGTSTDRTRAATEPVHTVLGEGTLWEGEIRAGARGLRIEGRVEGSIVSEGQVTVAPTGLVKGSIRARHLVVSGRVEGLFKVEGRLEIHGSGWVEGDVESGSLVVDEGGTLQGSCLRPAATAPRGPEPVPLLPRREVPQGHPGSPAASGTLDLRPLGRGPDWPRS